MIRPNIRGTFGDRSAHTSNILDISPAVAVVLDGLAVARVARLMTSDTITERPRKAIFRRFPPKGALLVESDGWEIAFDRTNAVSGSRALARRGAVTVAGRLHLPGQPGQDIAPEPMVLADGVWLGKLLQCQWCSGTWAAMFVVCSRLLFPRLWTPLGMVLAYSQSTGMMAETAEGG